MRRGLTSIVLLALAWLALPGAGLADAPSVDCVPPSAWIVPATRERTSHAELIGRLAGARIVLLGESHDDASHHRLQLHVIAALHARAKAVVLGFEMFPRRVQPVLDRWVAGEFDEPAFLAETDWREVWGADPALYMPLFHFARMHRVPMRALNVDRSLIRRVRDEGWLNIPADAREGVSDPVPASDAYEEWLVELYRQHLVQQESNDGSEATIDRTDPGFRRFVEAQLTWDRAMAEALAAMASAPGAPLVIGVIGSGHLRDGYGVPHQLADLGLDAAVLLPWDYGRDCGELTPRFADAVFGLDAPGTVASPPPPRLGVLIGGSEAGVAVIDVVDGSVAEAAGIRAGDVIVEAAGVAVREPGDLIAVVDRQAPGTWLPLRVARDGAPLEIIAKFPASR